MLVARAAGIARRARALLRRLRGRLPAPAVPEVSLDAKDRYLEGQQAALATLLAGDGRVTLPCAAHPVVSVVLVLYNKAELTCACLQSLAQTLDVPAEVLIVDNASTDRTAELLARVDGARILRQESNLHFLRGANLGAAGARGRYLLFLNNDTVLEPGAVAAACAVLETQPDAGAVGGKIVRLDGRLQEAGSVLWNDGSAAGVGRGADPALAEFAFRRDVDFCSGAFLLLRRELFAQLGGFDEHYAPAYYEDVDLCLRLWESGWRVVYEPRAQLRHFEWGSSHRTRRAQEWSATNRQRLLLRHAARLRDAHLAPGHMLEARMRSSRPRVLFLDDGLPLRDAGSGYPRAAAVVQALCEAGAFVTHCTTQPGNAGFARIYASVPPEVEMADAHAHGGLAAFLRARQGYYDVAIVSRPHVMQAFSEAMPALPGFTRRTALVYDAEAIYAPREAARAAIAGRPMSAEREQKALAAELELACMAPMVLAVSRPEAERFRAAGHADVRVLGHAIEAAPSPAGFDERRDLLFVGRLLEPDSPNGDSVRWFVTEVMPVLDTLIGTAWTLHLAGAVDAGLARALAGPRVSFLGKVDDLAPVYAQARVFIAPTRFAAGIPTKVVEAAAYGVPVVATPLLAEQLGWADGAQLLSGADAAGFAAACGRLYREPALWSQVREGALARVRADHEPGAFVATMRGILQDCCPGKIAASPD